MNASRLSLLLIAAACLAGCTSGSGSLGGVSVDLSDKSETSQMTLSGEFALNDPATHHRVSVNIWILERAKQPRPMVDLSKGSERMSGFQPGCMQWLCLYFADMKADRLNGSENLRKIREEILAGLGRDVYSRAGGNVVIQDLYLTNATVTAQSAR